VQNNRVPAVPVAAHPVLSVGDLNVTFRSRRGAVPAVRNVSFDIARGEVFAVIGESGSGKSSLAMAMMALLPPTALVTGTIRLTGIDLSTLSGTQRRRICGERVSLINQDALSSLNPCTTVGYQIAEMLMVHRGMAKRAAMAEAVRLLALTGVPSPEGRVHHYPHQYSGGMRQRALIAIALALQPDLVIADEPTTALDATIKAQILQLLTRLRAELGMSILIITHDMGVVAKMADRMLVMYAGQAVETGTVEEVFARPTHPYTAALLEAVPRLDATERPLRAIPGAPPAPSALPPGCPFHPRCPVAEPRCAVEIPRAVTLAEDRTAACLLALDRYVVA
jgi:oligopeptide/dipeptide ABC transporter ATP-binding protein